MPGRNKLNIAPVIGALLGSALLVGCAGMLGAGGEAGWRKLTQVEKRFAIYMEDPAPEPVAGLATFRFFYIYAPGAVQYEGQPVSWQEYSAMTVNCAEDTVKVGPRKRYGADGTVIASDDNQEFAPIIGPAVTRAADVSCRGITTPEQVVIPDGPAWRDAARANIEVSEPF